MKKKQEALNKQEDTLRLESQRIQLLETQLSVHQAHEVISLYELFEKNSYDDHTKMDREGLFNALNSLAFFVPEPLRDTTYKQFDMDGAGYIEFGDFGATLSTFARSVEEDVLYLLFQIFDHDNDGYLMREDVARILLAHNMIEASVLKKIMTKSMY